jgi:predicted DNA-binding transcriptional regulator AlpA
MTFSTWRPDRIISERVAAEILGISPDTLRRLDRRGEGPTRRKISPRRVGYKISEVEAYRDGKLIPSKQNAW